MMTIKNLRLLAHRLHLPVVVVAVLLLLLPSQVHAGANADCLSSPTWIAKTSKIKDGIYTDLNQCQLDELLKKGVNFEPNNNLIGGDGDATMFEDIYIGGKSDGCQSTENCMKDCQALCCIVPNCTFAVIHRDEDTYCPLGAGTCSVWKEDAYYWYCNLYSGGNWKNTDDDTTCYVESTTAKSSTCASVAYEGLGFNQSTYQSLLYLGTNCSTSRRNLINGNDDKALVSRPEDESLERYLKATRSAASIKATVQKGIRDIRSIVLPGIRTAIAMDGGLQGFGSHLGDIAKSLSKTSKAGSPGKKGMRNKKL